MQNTSNPEIQGFGRRLQQGLAKMQEKPATHPEPDLLAAFAEHTLSKREEAQIFEHLAICELCREVLALSAPEAESAATTAIPQISGKWSAFFSQWSWVPLTACTLSLLAVISVTVTRQARESRETASVFDNYAKTHTEAKAPGKPDSAATKSQPETADSEGKPALRSAESLATISPGVVGSVSGGAASAGPRQNLKKEAISRSVAAAPNRASGAYAYDANLVGNMSLEQRRDLNTKAYSFTETSDKDVAGKRFETTRTSSLLTAAAQPPTPQNAPASPAVDDLMSNARLQTNISTLPHEKDQEVRARQVYPPKGPDAATEFHADGYMLDGNARVEKAVKTKQNAPAEGSSDEIASAASSQEHASPNLAYATGTPLWTNQNGQSQNKIQQNELSRAEGDSPSVQQSVIFQRNGVRLPGNEPALKVAQLGTVWFAVAQSGGLKLSKDNGASWKDIAGPWQGPLKNVHTQGTLVQVETAANETWSSSDQGTTWTKAQPQNSNQKNQ